MENLKTIVNKINRRSKNMSTETYEATIQGLKDIHDDENPVKYWLSVILDDKAERKLFVEQNCRQMNKGDRVKVTGYIIKKPGSNNQTCIKIEPVNWGDAQTSAPTPQVTASNKPVSTGHAVNPSVDQWNEKYRLTMSNLLSSILPAKGIEEYDSVYVAVDKIARKILSPTKTMEPITEDVPF
jgi:hypothetical protein